MPDKYAKVDKIIAGVRTAGQLAAKLPEVERCLTGIWMAEYGRRNRLDDVVEVDTDQFTNLFDISEGRLIAAWGLSAGRASHTRDKSRMAGHPLSAGPGYHRGHAIPHTLGGGTDINLVPQLGPVNIGAFRRLEKAAVATPGAFYFTHWRYTGQSQTPTGVEQGLIIPGHPLEWMPHGN